jgi:N-acylneuraminate cytidylyltransferase
LPNKNVRMLAGRPLLAYSVSAAIDSGVFDAVVVSTDSEGIADVARSYGAEIPFLRPVGLAGDTSPDIDWVRHALTTLAQQGRSWDCFSILRPTSPFRRSDTIRRAWDLFLADGRADSLRAVQLCREHPAKMWILTGDRMKPVMTNPDQQATPWHSTPYQALPRVYVQNASLEIARSEAVMESGTISGEEVLPFFTEELEGFDINGPDDWILAGHYANENPASLPAVELRT